MALRKTALLCCLLCVSGISLADLPREIRLALAGRDYTEAIAWLLPNASAGNAKAAFELGKLYQLGKGVPADPEAASVWFELAADDGNTEAAYLLALVLEDLGRTSEAADRMHQAADAGSASARRWLDSRTVTEPLTLTLEQAISSDIQDAGSFSNAELSLADGQGTTPLILAVREGSLFWLQQLVAARIDLDAQDNLGNTALHYAVAAQNQQQVNVLLTAGADPDLRSSIGSTPLHMAIAAGESHIVRRLLSAGANRNIVDGGGWTAEDLARRSADRDLRQTFNLDPLGGNTSGSDSHRLSQAIENGNLKDLSTLLRKTVDLNQLNGQGDSPLAEAIRADQPAVVKLLFPETSSTLQFEALTVAAECSNGELFDWLLNQPSITQRLTENSALAIFPAITTECDACLSSLARAEIDLNTRNAAGDTPLIVAARANLIAIAQQLISLGNNLDDRDGNGRSALWWAAESGNSRVIEVLLEHGANRTSDSDGLSPLHIAASRDRDAATRQLITADNLDSITSAGNSALQLAASRNATAALTTLLARGAEVEHRNAGGDTALILAAQAGAYEAADLLLSAGASPTARNNRFDSTEMIIERRSDQRWLALIADRKQSGILDIFD